ncbi:hypothetical protein [Neptunicella marina]|uniref:Uncharacterized protein n=1 Tax=Neptunicella marina TaxID=2125989 RepID=A0A8J6IQS0_9ALTE|nr:hypothetical protein [Neptunicella marina]MBC3765895.1 hypothetical protein [Neptunicella marina]
MIRLSKRGWNNVLIIVSLLLIILFSNMGKLFNSANSTGPQPLLPEGSEILRIDYGTHQIERIGRGWRITPATGTSESQLSQITQHWLSTNAAPIAGKLNNPWIVTLWLAGEAQGRVFKLLPQGNDVLIEMNNNLYIASQHGISDYIPLELM